MKYRILYIDNCRDGYWKVESRDGFFGKWRTCYQKYWDGDFRSRRWLFYSLDFAKEFVDEMVDKDIRRKDSDKKREGTVVYQT